jgi:hypothetical protein
LNQNAVDPIFWQVDEEGRGTRYWGRRSASDTKYKNIFGNRFSILRLKKRLAGPRVAAWQHGKGCAERNHNSDEPSG